MRSRRRRYRRRNPAGETLAKFGLAVVGGLIGKGLRWASAYIPAGKAVQDASFVGMMALAAFGASYVSEPLMLGLGGALGVEGANIGQFWFLTLSTPSTAASTSTGTSTSTSTGTSTPTGTGAIATGLGAFRTNVRPLNVNNRGGAPVSKRGVASARSSF